MSPYKGELSMFQLELKHMLCNAGYKASWWSPRYTDFAWGGRLYFQSTHPTAKIWLEFDPPCFCYNPRLEIKIPGSDWGEPEHHAVWDSFKRAERIALKYEKELAEELP